MARASHRLLSMVAAAAPEMTLDVGARNAPSAVHVLIVDDDPRVREIVAAAMSSLGFQVLVTEDGAPALRIAEQTPPDLAIVDYDMPTPGLEVVRKLKAVHGAAIWVAVLTGRDDECTRSASFAAGADDVLAKPVMVADLKRRIVAAARTQRALVEARLAGERASRLLAGSIEAAAMLAHDLNNCLAIALGNVAYLNEAVHFGEGEIHALSAIATALRRMSGMVATFVAPPKVDASTEPADPLRADPRGARGDRRP
jgi:DNA-binding response OmpR family regulator